MVITSLSEYQDVTSYPAWNIYQSPCDFNRVYFIRSGEAYYSDGSITFQFKPNYLYILPTNNSYHLRHNSENPLFHMFFHITTTPIIDKLVEIEVKDGSFLHDLILISVKNISNENNEQMLRIFDLIVNIATEQFNLYEKTNPTILKAKKYIDENFQEKITLNDICKFINLDRSYFIRKFKEVYNISPKKYIIDEKLRKSLNMLKENVDITLISEKLGYENSHSFIVAFKQKYGMTPKAYKSIVYNSAQNSKKFLPQSGQT